MCIYNCDLSTFATVTFKTNKMKFICSFYWLNLSLFPSFKVQLLLQLKLCTDGKSDLLHLGFFLPIHTFISAQNEHYDMESTLHTIRGVVGVIVRGRSLCQVLTCKARIKTKVILASGKRHYKTNIVFNLKRLKDDAKAWCNFNICRFLDILSYMFSYLYIDNGQFQKSAYDQYSSPVQ